MEHSKAEAEKFLKSAISNHEQELAQLKQQEADSLTRIKEQADLEKDKALLALEKDYQKQIQVLKEKNQSDVDKYQQKYFDLLQQLKSITSSSQESKESKVEDK